MSGIQMNPVFRCPVFGCLPTLVTNHFSYFLKLISEREKQGSGHDKDQGGADRKEGARHVKLGQVHLGQVNQTRTHQEEFWVFFHNYIPSFLKRFCSIGAHLNEVILADSNLIIANNKLMEQQDQP